MADIATKIVTQNFGNEAAKSIVEYERLGGYAALRKALATDRGAIIDEVKKSSLRGRGGAGFSTGLKWTFIPKEAKSSYLVVNADEGEPGTFKDRALLAWDPHLLIEGALIAAYAIRASHIFIYIRGEFVREHSIFARAVEEAYAKGYLGVRILGSEFSCEFVVHRGAGAYICGEETALLNSLEGKRGWPRLKPPFPAVKGLFGQPTIVNNVETLMNVPWIATHGGDAFAALGVPKNGGLRLLCVSGHVDKPGIYELPMGVSLLEVIEKHCGGVRGGRKLKGCIPGGSSMPILTAEECDVAVDFDTLMTSEKIRPVESKPGEIFHFGGRPLRTMGGSGGVIVFDETTDMVAVCARIMRFYAHESCGQCTPCREGTDWLARITTRMAEGNGRPRDLEPCESVARHVARHPLCPPGDPAPWPMSRSPYRPEFAAAIARRRDEWVARRVLRAVRADRRRRVHRRGATRSSARSGSSPPSSRSRGLRCSKRTSWLPFRSSSTARSRCSCSDRDARPPRFRGNRPCARPALLVGLAAVGVLAWRLAAAVGRAGDPAPAKEGFGTVRAIGNLLLHEYIFPFEAVSIVLLVAVVGAVVIARLTSSES